jgi:ABC-type uncharacterized transport system substrate-binding protein
MASALFTKEASTFLDVRDTQGDLTSRLATSVTLAVKRATKSVPIVFYAGTDPVAVGLVVSFRKPEGRLTGIHGQFSDDPSLWSPQPEPLC